MIYLHAFGCLQLLQTQFLSSFFYLDCYESASLHTSLYLFVATPACEPHVEGCIMHYQCVNDAMFNADSSAWHSSKSHLRIIKFHAQSRRSGESRQWDTCVN